MPKKMKETGWLIAGAFGAYSGWCRKREDAIWRHCRDVDETYARGKCDIKAAWQRCRRRGDRAVKVTLTWEQL